MNFRFSPPFPVSARSGNRLYLLLNSVHRIFLQISFNKDHFRKLDVENRSYSFFLERYVLEHQLVVFSLHLKV